MGPKFKDSETRWLVICWILGVLGVLWLLGWVWYAALFSLSSGVIFVASITFITIAVLFFAAHDQWERF